mgnify:CR=1 FL=1
MVDYILEETTIHHVNGKFRIVFERSAVKGVDGFKVEANGDQLDLVKLDAETLYQYAQKITKPDWIPEV